QRQRPQQFSEKDRIRVPRPRLTLEARLLLYLMQGRDVIGVSPPVEEHRRGPVVVEVVEESGRPAGRDTVKDPSQGDERSQHTSPQRRRRQASGESAPQRRPTARWTRSRVVRAIGWSRSAAVRSWRISAPSSERIARYRSWLG